MLKLLKLKLSSKFFQIERTEWEFWLFVVSLVTILGFFVQSRHQVDVDMPYFRSQTKAEIYDIRLPNNSRIVQDHLETGR